MAGELLQAARADALIYLTEGGFESDITIIHSSGNPTANIKGWASKHHLNFDTDGTAINAKNAHISIAEKTLTDLGYPVRTNEEVDLLNHRVDVKDSSGILKNYIIKETLPDESLGVIVCILGDFEV